MLNVLDQAPDFKLPDQNNQMHQLSDYAGRWLLLFFYPKDDTPGCTIEACTIRDHWLDFKKSRLSVLGVSTDSVSSHSKFSKKYYLPFPILADDHKEVVNLYGVWGDKKFLGREFQGTKRTSFLIDPQGKIKKIYQQVKPRGHAQEVLKDLEKLSI